MPITDKAVEKYMMALLAPRDALLSEIEQRASIEGIPIVGPVVGRLFEQLAQLVGARRVFEMGSAVGYSTIWWARAVGPAGRVYYTDGSAENARSARDYLRRADLDDRVDILTGNALDLLDSVDGEFDIVFNDVDKHYYPQVYHKAAGRVRPGGLLVSDNVLWSGWVADPGRTDPDTEGVREFNRLLYADPRYLTTIMPLRDGISIARRVEFQPGPRGTQ